jgi:prepilin-type N-terminal cleavage/methylation domain-containing protein
VTQNRFTLPRRILVHGFTLTEMAIVLIIVSLLIGGMFMSLTTSQDLVRDKETQKQLATANDALLGFAASNGRLPCPATPTSGGKEAFCSEGDLSKPCGVEVTTAQTHGRCMDFFNGFLPSATLGTSPTDSAGFAIDAWGNRIHYAVSNNPITINIPAPPGVATFPSFTTHPTTDQGLKGIWARDPSQLKPDIRVCNTSANLFLNASESNKPDCPVADQMTASAVAIVLSTGKNGAITPTNADELANWTTSSDRVFVSHTPTPDFDDIVTWLSPNVLYNRMISAGRLP